jgi:hypothetical protein
MASATAEAGPWVRFFASTASAVGRGVLGPAIPAGRSCGPLGACVSVGEGRGLLNTPIQYLRDCSSGNSGASWVLLIRPEPSGATQVFRSSAKPTA